MRHSRNLDRNGGVMVVIGDLGENRKSDRFSEVNIWTISGKIKILNQDFLRLNGSPGSQLSNELRKTEFGALVVEI
jgi:hypothetical protein